MKLPKILHNYPFSTARYKTFKTHQHTQRKALRTKLFTAHECTFLCSYWKALVHVRDAPSAHNTCKSAFNSCPCARRSVGCISKMHSCVMRTVSIHGSCARRRAKAQDVSYQRCARIGAFVGMLFRMGVGRMYGCFVPRGGCLWREVCAFSVWICARKIFNGKKFVDVKDMICIMY